MFIDVYKPLKPTVKNDRNNKRTMGQLNFFMTKDEIDKEVEELIISELFLVFNGSFFNSKHPIPMNSSTEIGDSKRLIIWIKNKITQPKCSNNGAGNYIDKFLFDYYFDPIIEFDIEPSIDNLISPNRLFYKTGWITDKVLREIHAKETNKLVRRIKKKLVASEKTKPFYISKGTIELLNKGFELELGPGGRKINKQIINST